MSKTVKEDCHVVSIYDLKNWGYLNNKFCGGLMTWTSNFSEKKNSIGFNINTDEDNNKSINLNYTITNSYSGEKEDIDHKYPITTTPCNYGGNRQWFICSVYNRGIYCGRRVAKLYLGANSNYFACRHCYDLTYRSKIEGYTYCLPDLEEYEKKIKRYYYNGKPTRKYRNYLRMERSFEMGWIKLANQLSNRIDRMK